MRYGYRRHSMLAPILIGVIVLCLIAIGVLTWFLFRSGSFEDGKIGVNATSGKVVVDIVDTENNTLIGDVIEFVPKDGEDKVIFAPGLAYRTEGFRVKNDGNLDIKYRIYISEDEKVDSEKFAEAFDFYITTDPENFENAEKLTSFSGALADGDASELYYLVVSMKVGAGNEFQDKEFSGIGVTVHAVQSNDPAEP